MKIFLLLFFLMSSFLNSFTCDTPVYKYALWNWIERNDFIVIHIYNSEKKEKKLTEKLSKKIRAVQDLANISYMNIDSSKGEIEALKMQGDFVALIEKFKAAKTEMDFIISPNYDIVFQGVLTENDLNHFLVSPKSLEMANALSKLNTCFILIKSSEESKNNHVKKLVKIQFDLFKDEMKEFEGKLIVLDKKDPKEKFLVAQLMAHIPKKLKDEGPILFGVVGRGFVFTDALVDKDINGDELNGFLKFLTGPCSCTVKSQAGGCDLLLKFDWDKFIIPAPKDEKEEEMNVSGFGGQEEE